VPIDVGATPQIRAHRVRYVEHAVIRQIRARHVAAVKLGMTRQIRALHVVLTEDSATPKIGARRVTARHAIPGKERTTHQILESQGRHTT